MARIIYSTLWACAVLTLTAVAAEPTVDLEPKEAVRMVSLKSGELANSIQIAFIVEGSAKCGEGFEVRHVRRVAALHGVRDGASKTRQLVFYDLLWNEALGWFMWESRDERTGTAVYIWSELRGAIVNR